MNVDRNSQGERTPALLLEASLRMRPDRIILVEVCQLARKAIDRLATLVMTTGLGIGFEEVKRYCEGFVDLVVQMAGRGGRRSV